MASIRKQILEAARTALLASVPPAGLTVDRFRTLPNPPGTTKRVSIYPAQEGVQRVGNQIDSPLVERSLIMRFECRASAIGSTTPDDALDDLLVWVISALYADQTLGGLANYLAEVQTTWDAEASDQTYAVAWLDVLVHYATLTADQSRRI